MFLLFIITVCEHVPVTYDPMYHYNGDISVASVTFWKLVAVTIDV